MERFLERKFLIDDDDDVAGPSEYNLGRAAPNRWDFGRGVCLYVQQKKFSSSQLSRQHWS